jgi:hypothetical protein
MSLNYFAGDELPAFEATITLNGATVDFSSGWTFTVKLTSPGETTVTKTTGITGASTGTITVAWATGELNIKPARWRLQLTATRTADQRQFTIQDEVVIKPRTLVEA